MQEMKQNKVLIVTAIAAIVFFVGMVHFFMAGGRLKAEVTKEKSSKFDLEKAVDDARKKELTSQDQIERLTKQLGEEKAAAAAMKKTLTQEQLINKSLKEELQKITKLKEALEQDLKQLLASGRPEPVKK